MNNPLFFEIQADDVQRAVNFYTQIFGWHFVGQPEAPVEYFRIETNGISGGLLRRPAARPAAMSGTNAAVISMEVARFDDTAQQILEHGGTEAMPKFPVPGRCWQGYFIDTEGNTFGILKLMKPRYSLVKS